MLALSFIRHCFGDIWFFEENDIFEYIQRIIISIFILIASIPIFLIDIVLSPIELVAGIMYITRRKK